MKAPWSTPGSPSAPCAQIGKNVHLPAASASAACSNRSRLAGHHRRQLFHRRPFGSRRRRRRRRKLGHLDGRLHRPEHPDLRPRNRRNQLRQDPAGSVVISGSLPAMAASTACTLPSSSRRSTRKPAPRPASTNCCALSQTNHEGLAMILDKLFQLMAENRPRIFSSPPAPHPHQDSGQHHPGQPAGHAAGHDREDRR